MGQATVKREQVTMNNKERTDSGFFNDAMPLVSNFRFFIENLLYDQVPLYYITIIFTYKCFLMIYN